MLDSSSGFHTARQRLNLWLLNTLGRDWLDYIASNTMTELNRRYNDFIWTYELKAIVTAIHDEAPDIKTFTLMPNQHWKGMQPGQHVAIHAEIGGKHVTRYYSATPTPQGGFTITLKRHPEGMLSDWLHAHVKPGSILHIEQAQGQFRYRQQPKLLFICAGTGITPCHSIIDHLLQRPVRPDMQLYAQFQQADMAVFKPALQRWQQQGLPITLAFSRKMVATQLHSNQPVLDADNFADRFADFRERDIYLCGPQGFMDKIIAILRQHEFDFTRLHCERFTLAAQTAVQNAEVITEGEIYFRHLDRHVRLSAADQGKSLLQIAEENDICVESGCRQGMCGTCKLTLHDGQVSGNQIGNAVYLCSSFPASSRLVLDA